MLLFEFDDGELFPAQIGSAGSGELDPEVLAAVREHVLEVIGKPLFAVRWDTEGTGPENAGPEPYRLIAMDASGQVVSVEVVRTLTSATLVDALAQSGRTATLGWLDLAALYPRGSGSFRRDWNAFRESLPPRPLPGPRLFIVTSKVLDEVRPALEVLADSGVEVFEVVQRQVSDGRRFVEVTEPYRISVPTLSAYTSIEATRRPAIDAASDLRRSDAGPSPDDVELPGSIPATPEAIAGAETAAGLSQAAAAAAGEPSSGRATAESSADLTQDPSQSAPAAAQQPVPAVNEDARDLEIMPVPEEPDSRLALLAREADQELTLVWVQLRKGTRHEVRLMRDGLLTLPDGRIYADPSAAAAAASGRHAADGWRVWRLGERGITLQEMVERAEARQAAADAPAETNAETGADAVPEPDESGAPPADYRQAAEAPAGPQVPTEPHSAAPRPTRRSLRARLRDA